MDFSELTFLDQSYTIKMQPLGDSECWSINVLYDNCFPSHLKEL